MAKGKKKKLDSLGKFQKEVEKIIVKGLEAEECSMSLEYIRLMSIKISSKAIDYAGEFHASVIREV